MWVSTGANPADYPPRGAPIPPPMEPPQWLKNLVPDSVRFRVDGRELLPGCAVITRTLLGRGLRLEALFDAKINANCNILVGEVFGELLKRVASAAVVWLWLSPPCSSFSALQNGHRDGPWHTKVEPRGHGRAETEEGNQIWRRYCQITQVANKSRVQTILEHFS